MTTTATAPVALARHDALYWPANDRAPAAARHAVRRFLGTLGAEGAAIASDAEVVVSELVTNSVRAYQCAPGYQAARPGHGSLSLEIRHGTLLIEVTDRAPGLPDWHAQPDYISETGRGLHMVKNMCSGHCGHYRTRNNGKCVWAALLVPATAGTATLQEPTVTGLRWTA